MVQALIGKIANTLFVTCLCAIMLLSNEATASVIYRLSGTVIEADEGSSPSVGDSISGFVELTDEAVAASPPYEFALGYGDVLDIFIQFGPYRWDISRPSVDWVQFEGYLAGDKQSIGSHSLQLIENFSGVISDEYCPPTTVCIVTEGGNNIMALYEGWYTALGQTSWERCSPFPGGGSTAGCFPGPGPFPLDEPAALDLLPLCLAGLFSRRKHAS